MTGFPGDADALRDEVDRLNGLRDRLWDGARRVLAFDTDTWRGAAAEAFEVFRQRLGKQLRRAGDHHEDAAIALDRYRETLVHLQSLNRHAPDLPDGQRARWHLQLAAEAEAAKAALDRAADGLGEIRVELPEHPADESATVPAAAGPVPRRWQTRLELAASAASDEEHAVDPRAARDDPHRYYDQVRALVAEVMRNVFVPVQF
ncbi:hypothetical protein [Actinokineospora sp. NBRC 105648]|uniref:hypothetical protein n=1 Tax=Actinokineospora sp. NBRC 105648 TaxID=3032206 RepID=UPI00249FE009|nr:hypothetical protein [Actinokineospora sp. NBRC 105648]GLZ38726.1 hypothetical protein Acsp05_23500 [Actinokineospora sp. NBRC 105648]